MGSGTSFTVSMVTRPLKLKKLGMMEDKTQVPVGIVGLGIWSGGLPEEPQLQGRPNQSRWKSPL